METKQENAIITGNIPKQLMLFFLPIFFGTLFQQLYNTVDTLVVGNFVGTQALAAVGATGSFVNLLVGFFAGLCSGAGIIISQSYGAQDRSAVDRQVHTALALAAAGGAALTALGLLVSRPVLVWMNTPAEILPMAAQYLQVYFLGMIPQMLYNMGTGILRAVGDSRRPLYYLIAASLVNIVLDLAFVAGLHWGVAGAALATIISQLVSAVLTLRCLARDKTMPWTLQLNKIRLTPPVLRRICGIGLPGAFQSSLYSISNIIIQSTVNGFGTTVVAAWSVYGKIDFMFWMTLFAMGTSVTTFAGQNFGARRYERVRRGNWWCLGIASAMTLAISGTFYPAAELLFRLFSQDEAVVAAGVQLMHFLVPVYITYVAVEVLAGTLRGCGDVKVPTLITVFCVCGLRVLWLLVVVPRFPSIEMVEASYPITWILSSVLFLAYYLKGGWLERCIAAQQHGLLSD